MNPKTPVNFADSWLLTSVVELSIDFIVHAFCNYLTKPGILSAVAVQVISLRAELKGSEPFYIFARAAMEPTNA